MFRRYGPPRVTATSHRSASFTLAVVVLFPQSLLSQLPASPKDTLSAGVGDPVRVTASAVSAKPLVGWVDRFEGANLVLAGTELGTLVTVPIGNVEKLELQVARRTRRKGALVGHVVGYLVGGVVALAWAEAEDAWAPAAAAGTIFFGAVGAGVGMGIGAVAAGDGWDTIPTDRILTRTAPIRGFRFGVSITGRGPR